jgi:hypothetical protein
MTPEEPGGEEQTAAPNPSDTANTNASEGPAQSNQGWEDLRRTAEEALQRPSPRTAPARTRATTWLLLGFVVVCVVGVGVWVIAWFAGLHVRNERIKMQALEEKAGAYQKQVEYTNEHHQMPDGVPEPPLTDEEAKEIEELHRKFGVRPATRPAITPAATPAATPATSRPGP